jgi:hypothetical protein
MKELDTAMNAQETPLSLGSFRFLRNHHIDDVRTGFVAPFLSLDKNRELCAHTVR